MLEKCRYVNLIIVSRFQVLSAKLPAIGTETESSKVIGCFRIIYNLCSLLIIILDIDIISPLRLLSTPIVIALPLYLEKLRLDTPSQSPLCRTTLTSHHDYDHRLFSYYNLGIAFPDLS